jgi:hypothetical protein
VIRVRKGTMPHMWLLPDQLREIKGLNEGNE